MQPEVNPRNFKAGDRVKYSVQRPQWLKDPHCFAEITKNMVMCCDATPYITATVTKIHPIMGVCIRPDGWPLKDGEGYQGFYANEQWLEYYADDRQIPGILTDRSGHPFTREQIDEELASHRARS